MVGGLSLGAASALGALAGAGWSTFRRYGDEIKAKLRGAQWLCVDENTLRILYLRQKQLLEKLIHRGHAASDTMQVETPEKYNCQLTGHSLSVHYAKTRPGIFHRFHVIRTNCIRKLKAS